MSGLEDDGSTTDPHRRRDRPLGRRVPPRSPICSTSPLPQNLATLALCECRPLRTAHTVARRRRRLGDHDQRSRWDMSESTVTDAPLTRRTAVRRYLRRRSSRWTASIRASTPCSSAKHFGVTELMRVAANVLDKRRPVKRAPEVVGYSWTAPRRCPHSHFAHRAGIRRWWPVQADGRKRTAGNGGSDSGESTRWDICNRELGALAPLQNRR